MVATFFNNDGGKNNHLTIFSALFLGYKNEILKKSSERR